MWIERSIFEETPSLAKKYCIRMIVMISFGKYVFFHAARVDGKAVVEGCYHTLNIKNKTVKRPVILT